MVQPQGQPVFFRVVRVSSYHLTRPLGGAAGLPAAGYPAGLQPC